MSRYLHFGSTLLVVGCFASISQASIWATGVYDSYVPSTMNTHPLENALGPADYPDGAGYTLEVLNQYVASVGQDGYVTYSFDQAFVDGPGDDLFLWHIGGGSPETGELLVSADGINFTYVGLIDDSVGVGSVGYDLAGIITDPVSYVKIADLADDNNAVDIDAIEAKYIPEPAVFSLLSLGALAFMRRH